MVKLVCIERDSGHAATTSYHIIDIPCIIGRVSGNMRRKVRKGQGAVVIERMKGGNISFVEGLGRLGENHITVVGSGSSGDARAIPPDEFLFLFDGSISEFFIPAAFGSKLAVRITDGNARFVIAICNIGTPVVFLHPSIDVFHVEGDNLTEARDLFLKSGNGGGKQVGEQATIELPQFFAKPIACGERGLDIKAVVSGEIKLEIKAELNDEQRMLEEKLAQLFGVDQAFFDVQQVGCEGMAVGAVTVGLVDKPTVNDRPVEQSKEGTIVLDKRINIEQRSDGGLVKATRCRYHSRRLLCVMRMSFFDTLHEGVFLWQVVEDVCATGAGIVSARSYLLDSCLMRR
jgi:hypothetical protein